MGAGKKATENAKMLEKKVVEIGESLGLNVKTNVKHGTTIWATVRRIKVVLSDDKGGKLGIDCFYQAGSGTAYLKYFAKELDVMCYQFKGIVVWGGAGFPKPFVGVLMSRGAIHINDLRTYIINHFKIGAN